MIKKFVLAAGLVFTGSSFCAVAQEMKLGFAQFDYILGLMPEAQAAQRDIATFERKLGNRLNAMRQGLQMQIAQLEKESANLSDSVKAIRQGELLALQQDIAQEQNTAEQQLQFKEIQAMSPLRSLVQDKIDSVAQANGYSHIFTVTLDENPVLIYAADPKEADVTTLVMNALGLTAPTPTVPADTTAGQ